MSHRVVATAGHVDHGKSLLLRALTGMEPDRLDEERRRGLTIDLGFVWTTLPAPGGATSGSQTVAFVDVPGHERFIATMLSGAGAAPLALPVVAADDGWKQQSAEHRDVLDLLQVPAVALVVSKADLVDAGRVDEVVAEVTREVAGTSLDGAPVVVTDAVSRRGVDDLKHLLAERLAVLPPPADLGRPRLWIDRSFAIVGAGTVVTGTLAEGTFNRGDEVRLLPQDVVTRIRGLQSLGAPVDRAGPGSRVAVNLVGVDHAEVTRGDVLVGVGPWQLTRVADLWVRAVTGHRIERTGAWHLHVGSASTTCHLTPLTGPIEAPRHGGASGNGTGTSNFASADSSVAAGRDGGSEPGSGAVRVVLDHPLPLVAGDRVVLRDAGRRAVVGGGVVADPSPKEQVRGRKRRAARAQALAGVAVAPRAQRLAALVRLAGGSRRTHELLATAGWSPRADLPAGLERVGGHVVVGEVLDEWVRAVRELGAGTHDRGAVASAARAVGADGDVAGELADHLAEAGVLVRTAGGYALPEHVDAATAARRRRGEALVEALAADPFSPPDLDEAARAAGVDHREVAALVQSGAIVRCGKVAFARVAIDLAIERLRELAADRRVFTAAEAKEAWGTTRRHAIPLLEHLDRTGVTAFDGQRRHLR